MSQIFRYAVFDDAGRCTGIMRTPVDLGLPHLVADTDRPEQLFLDAEGELVRKTSITLTASRHWLVCDGADRVIVTGLPRRAGLQVNGTPIEGHAISATAPGTLVIEAAGCHRVEPFLIEADTLANFAMRFAADVDRQAEAARAAHGTVIAQQQDIYRRKEAEARRVADGLDGWPDAPFLSAEAAERGMSIHDLAADVIAKADAWAAVSAAIEAKRVAAKRTIAVAADVETMTAATEIAWPEPAEQQGA